MVTSPDFRAVLSQQAAGHTLEAVDQLLDVIVFSIACDQLGLEVAADFAEDVLQVADCQFRQHVAPVCRNKDPMDMKHVDNMPSCSILHVCAPQTKC